VVCRKCTMDAGVIVVHHFENGVMSGAAILSQERVLGGFFGGLMRLFCDCFASRRTVIATTPYLAS